jgi:phosphoglycerate dehydrogenase-like enzyme
LHSLVINAAASEDFWQFPAHFERALTDALPEGFNLKVCRDARELPEFVKTSRAVIGWPFAAALATQAPELGWVHFWTAGVPEAWEELSAPRLRLTCARGVNASSVAEHALFLVLAGLRGMRADSFVPGSFSPSRFAVARNPAALTAAVIGHGNVGQRLERLLRPLFSRVHVVSRTPCEPSDAQPRVVGLEKLTAVVSESDVIVLALPFTARTRELLTSAQFYASLKPDVLLVNVARGALVDERALLAHLSQHPGASYLTDVTQPEPYPAEGSLWSCSKVLITPHVAGRRADLWAEHERLTLSLAREILPSLKTAP